MRTRLVATVAACALFAAVFVTASPAAAQTTITCPPGDASDLQAAIDAADPGDTIRVAGRCEGTIVIRDGDNIRLLGYGPFAAIDGAGAGTVVTVEEGAQLLASDLTITGGSTSTDGRGGGMTIAGTVELVDVDVIHNEATGGAGATAGIRVTPSVGASVEARRGTISHNEATGIGATGAGGIAAGGDTRIALDGTMIIGNRTTAGAGAIRLSADPVVVLHDVKILDNAAVGGVSGAGGVRSAGDAALTITDSFIAFNRIEATAGNNGGALLLTSNTTTTIESTTIAFNSATNSAVADGDPGGIHIGSNATLDGSDLAVIGNRGNLAGGLLAVSSASVDVNSSVFVLNRANPGGTGGVVSDSTGPVTVGLVALNSPGQCSGPVNGTCLF